MSKFKYFLVASTIALMSLSFQTSALVAQETEAPAKGSSAKGSSAKEAPAEKGEAKSDDKEMKVEPVKVAVADGTLNFLVPGNWKKKTPRFPNIIEVEFEVPNVDGDKNPGRMTISKSGGGMEANVKRWIGQFKQGEDAGFKKDVKSKTIAGYKTQLVTLSGTFMSGSPMGPKTPLENYQMQGLIVERDGGPDYFVKVYAGKKTMAANKAGLKQLFDKMTATKK